MKYQTLSERRGTSAFVIILIGIVCVFLFYNQPIGQDKLPFAGIAAVVLLTFVYLSSYPIEWFVRIFRYEVECKATENNESFSDSAYSLFFTSRITGIIERFIFIWFAVFNLVLFGLIALLWIIIKMIPKWLHLMSEKNINSRAIHSLVSISLIGNALSMLCAFFGGFLINCFYRIFIT